eukprot:gene5380-5600_t
MATRNPSLSNSFSPRESSVVLPDGVGINDAELFNQRGTWWWTGKTPEDCPGFSAVDGVLRSLPLPPTKGYTRQQLLDTFDNCWTLTEILFASLQGTDAFSPPPTTPPAHQLRIHPKWFYYHYARAHPGPVPSSSRHSATDWPSVREVNEYSIVIVKTDRPLVREVNEYRKKAYNLIRGVIESHPSLDDPTVDMDQSSCAILITPCCSPAYFSLSRKKAYNLIRGVIETHPSLDDPSVDMDQSSPAWAVFMCFEHERIHLETSSVLMRELPLASVLKPKYWPDYHPSAQLPSPAIPSKGMDYPANEMVQVEGEKVCLGKPPLFPSFGWDNEYGSRELAVETFKASKYKVTNGEFLNFVKAGGYANTKYWSTEGWGWKTFRNVKWPTFWIVDGPQGLHRYKLRALFDAIDMCWDWPVDVNYHEAKAFCAWKTESEGENVSYRIISEGEHNLLRNAHDRVDSPMDDQFFTPGSVIKGVEVCGANMQLAFSSQSPVTELPPSEKGFHDVFGNAWEWAEDHYSAFPGFKVHPFYEDFSSPCFGGKHQLILGGSFISTGQMCSKFARYQFRPHFFQHASFRVVQQVVDVSKYDMARYGPHCPLKPFYPTSCMDCAPPYVGDGPCCSVERRSAFTPTMEEERTSSLAKRDATQGLYETDALMAQYLALHYGPPSRVYHPVLLSQSSLLQSAIDFPQRVVEVLVQWARKEAGGGVQSLGRVLDLGCAVGRISFGLATHFKEVVGVDISSRFIEVANKEVVCVDISSRFIEVANKEVVGVDISSRFIEMANKVKDNGRVEYDMIVEGDITERVSALIDAEIDTSRVSFVQGDACHLPTSYHGSFDAVMVSNLLDRVPEPLQLLKETARVLRPGGLMLLSSPHSWSNEYTGKSNWLGGVYKDGLPTRSHDVLAQLLAPEFDVLYDDIQPIIIPEHASKYQLLVAQQLVLKKK